VFELPEKPQLSEVWGKVVRLARTATDPEDLKGSQEVVDFLRELDKDTWNQVINDAEQYNRYQAGRLLADPALIPDKVERARAVSRCLYGLPWWLREAHYWRVMRGKKKRGRPKGRKTTGDQEWN
jgi:hypothetical protein